MEHMWLVPPIVLVAVAAVQRWRMWRHRQSAWKGGGFGMFSEINRNSVAVILSTIGADGTVHDLRVDPGIPPSITCPTDAYLKRWGEDVARGEWLKCGAFAHLRPWYSTTSAEAIARVRITRLWLDFDARTGLYRAEERGTWITEGHTSDRTARG
jgi:hypothetical protein